LEKVLLAWTSFCLKNPTRSMHV